MKIDKTKIIKISVFSAIALVLGVLLIVSISLVYKNLGTNDANLIMKSAINDSDNNNITNINNHSINGCRFESNIINNNIDSSTNNNINIKPNLVRIGKNNHA